MMQRRIERGIAVAATICAALLLVAAASVAGITPLQSAADTESPETANVTGESIDGNGSEPVVRHRDPDSIEQSTVALDRTGLELARSLGVRLNVSASELRDEDFTAAEAELGSEYQNDVIRLTEIAEATENTSDDEIAAAYRTAGSEQREAVRDAAEFQDLYTEYQQARASQNETQAREAAQRLSAKFEEINASATELQEVYGELEQVNKSQAQRAQNQINQSLDQASRITQTTRESAYIETTLTVDTVRRYGSPTRPFILRGQLQTAEGEPLANRTVMLGSAAYNTTVQTDRAGQFTLRHRPTILKQGEQSVQLRYVPNATAGYLGTTASANVSVVQRDSTVEIQTAPETVTNGTTARVTGRVLVDTEGVEGVPVRLQIGDRQVATGRTDARGRFNLTTSPPLSIPEGATTASVVVATTNQGVAQSRQNASISVEEVPTTLSLSVERVRPQMVGLSGTLRRESGQPLDSQTIAISAGGQPLGWFQTDENGRFGGNLTFLENQPGIEGADITLTATFNGGTTHLETAQTTGTVTLPSFAPPGVFGYGISIQAWSLLVGAIVLLGGAIILTRRRSKTDRPIDNSIDRQARAEPNPPESPHPQSPQQDPLTMLESAQRAVTDAPREATRLGYMAVRTELARDLDLSEHGSLTHWEFYDTCQTREAERPTDHYTKFEQLTELYERAIYTDQPLADEQLDELLQYFIAEVKT